MSVEEYMEMTRKSREEINKMFESGMFNSILKGYLIKAMKPNCKDADIQKTLRVLDETLDFVSAEDAREEWEQFLE